MFILVKKVTGCPMGMAQRLVKIFLLALLMCFSFASLASNKPPIKAIVFDDFTIFDLDDITNKAEKTFPGYGKGVIQVLFEYQAIGSAENKNDIRLATEASLFFAIEQMHMALPEDKRKSFLESLMNLQLWPDTTDAIKQLKAMGIELIFLSNMPEALLVHQLKQTKLDKQFTLLLSADDTDTQKPDAEAYDLLINKSGFPKESILFVGHANWDVNAAKDYGYPTFWVNRTSEKGKANASGKDLASLVKFVADHNKTK